MERRRNEFEEEENLYVRRIEITNMMMMIQQICITDMDAWLGYLCQYIYIYKNKIVAIANRDSTL